MAAHSTHLQGAGLGLRRAHLGALAAVGNHAVDFLEIAPENWMGLGAPYEADLRRCSERWPLVCHGLSLSLGGPSPLDEKFLHALRRFFDRHSVAIYSEHLSYCGDDGHLYDLMPLPFTEEAVRHVAARIRRTQDVLGQRIAIENISYYVQQRGEMTEAQFIAAVLDEADCDLLLDINNLYVNSVNHGSDPRVAIRTLPAQRIVYLHVAGHSREAPDFVIDTHGAPIVDPVWNLLADAYDHLGPLPTLLERDFNLPPLDELLVEIKHIRTLQKEPRHACAIA